MLVKELLNPLIILTTLTRHKQAYSLIQLLVIPTTPIPGNLYQDPLSPTMLIPFQTQFSISRHNQCKFTPLNPTPPGTLSQSAVWNQW